MAELKNEFSWSVSRDRLFSECRRKYYYNHYGSWGGWGKHRADEVTRTLYVLKQLKNRWQWKGTVVHHEIERILKELVSTGGLVSLEKSIERVRRLMRGEFRYSRGGSYWQHDGSLRDKTALLEHEYKTGTSDETWKKNYDEVIGCLEAFYRSPVLDEIRNLPKENAITIEDMEAAYFSFSEEKFFVKLDLAYECEGQIRIVDWKTGAGEPDGLQFRLYTIYAAEMLDAIPEEVSLTEYNLQTEQATTHAFRAPELDDTVEYIKRSVAAMKGSLADPDGNIAAMKDFPRTDNEKTCEFCSFRKICFELD